MQRFKLTLEYDGTDFFGWQVQTRTGERTVQGTLQAALAKLPGQHAGLRAAGRTDAGVHALAMVAHVDSDTPLSAPQLQRALNAHLPPDVRVLGLEPVPSTFEAQYSCQWRYYRYRLRLARDDLAGTVLERRRVLHLFQDVDAEVMQRAAPLFEGSRDFAALATQETRNTERTVYRCRLGRSGRDLTLHIAADGFLRGMVRATLGTLLRVGSGKLSPADIPAILESKDRRRAGENVPPHGLYFVSAGYTPWTSETAAGLELD